MLTREAANLKLLVLTTLISLGLIAIIPFFGLNSVFAAESENEVDITYDDDNYDEADYDDSDSEEWSDEDEESDFEEEYDEDYIEDEETYEEDSDDESGDDLSDLFPESYVPYLEDLQEEHPSWSFVPCETGVDWETAVDAEDEGSHTLISPEAPDVQKKNNKKYDGRWNPASRDTIEYYMDPRNFLNEDEVYQFLLQTFDDSAQSVDTVASIIEGSFMDGESPGKDYESFASCIYDAGAGAGVNPNVLAAMIIMEQGWGGSSLVSGEKDGYEGYYNFFNIGAWTTDDMSASERGLWYAQGEGEDNTSYERPWDSPYKAILGGAEFYYENYISENQDTYYTKKFNVDNGVDSIGEHEYMTNVAGANDEGKLVRKAYEYDDDYPCTFEIPVYEDMPEDRCQLPE